MPEWGECPKDVSSGYFALPGKGEGVAWQFDNGIGSKFCHLVTEEVLLI